MSVKKEIASSRSRTAMPTFSSLMGMHLAEMLDAALVTSDVRLARTPGLRCAVDVLGD